MKRRTKSSKRPLTALHFPAGLIYVGNCFPGGLKTMIFLAWHSPDARIRQIAERWRKLDDEQATTELEDICDEVGIDTADLLGDVVRTAYQLEIDLSGVFASVITENRPCIIT